MTFYLVDTPEGVLLVCHPLPADRITMLSTYRRHIGYRQLTAASFCIVNVSDDPNILRYVVMKSRHYSETAVGNILAEHWAQCRTEVIPGINDGLGVTSNPILSFVVDDSNEIMMLKLKHG